MLTLKIFGRSVFRRIVQILVVGDDSVYGYEKTHLPESAWPPTSWYARWVSGLDVFDVEQEASPIKMRWLVYGKAGKD